MPVNQMDKKPTKAQAETVKWFLSGINVHGIIGRMMEMEKYKFIDGGLIAEIVQDTIEILRS